jgi:hypothetical protein
MSKPPCNQPPSARHGPQLSGTYRSWCRTGTGTASRNCHRNPMVKQELELHARDEWPYCCTLLLYWQQERPSPILVGAFDLREYWSG